ncbi:MucBP domain-containing protein [Listeria welshimeri]|uniref:MucBP domain-containing protein n=2 Tax=Listeria welshimeri TaxID=1643 RepID=UPI0022EB4E76|nr:MucBP domain-containing protein [Listeria welshimeri]
MKLKNVGALLLGTVLIFQAPFHAFAASLDNKEQVEQEAASPKAVINKQTLTAATDLEQIVGEESAKTIHVQDQALPNNEWGSYISEVKVTLQNMEGISYSIKYGPLSGNGTHYQYADITLSGIPTKAGKGSFSLEYYDGAGNGGIYPFKVNTKSKATIEYVDEDNNKLAENTVKTGDFNTAYTSMPIAIEGYEVDETKLPQNQNGQFAETNQTVTYTYSKIANEVAKGTVGISFYSTDGNCPELISSLDLGYAYPDGVPTDTVTFGDLANNATYNDLRNDTLPSDILWNDVMKNMVDYMEGNLDANQFEANVGASVNSFDLDRIARNFEGYKFDEAIYQENLNKMVTFDQNNGNVNLQVPFTKVVAGADVTVVYVDTEGNELAPKETLTGNVNDNYSSEAKTIDGWTLKETPKNSTGEFSKDAQTVTYIYEKNDDTNNFTPVPDNKADTDVDNSPTDNAASTNKNTPLKSSKPIGTEDTLKQVNSPKEEKKIITQNNNSDQGLTKVNKSLPKTGDNELESSILVGLGILLVGGIFVTLRRTRNTKEE